MSQICSLCQLAQSKQVIFTEPIRPGEGDAAKEPTAKKKTTKKKGSAKKKKVIIFHSFPARPLLSVCDHRSLHCRKGQWQEERVLKEKEEEIVLLPNLWHSSRLGLGQFAIKPFYLYICDKMLCMILL